MKFGYRKPSVKKSIKARTTGRIKRSVKSSINPLYGKSRMGFVNNPKNAVYNKIYNKTTFGIRDVLDTNSYCNHTIDNLELNSAIANNPYKDMTMAEIKQTKQEKKLKEKISSLKILKFSIPLLIVLDLLMCIIFPTFLISVFALVLLEMRINNKLKNLKIN